MGHEVPAQGMATLSFKLPERHKPTSESFDTRPKAVKAWVAALPMAHRGETARNLFRAVYEVNRLDFPGPRRFAFLEAIREPIRELLLDLRRQIGHDGIPVPERNKTTAHLANRLLAELIIGYRLVLRDGETCSWISRKLCKNRWIVAQHRLLEYCSTILCHQRLINQPYTKGLWQRVHRLYRRAAGIGWHRQKIVEYPGSSDTTTIDRTYKRIVLLAIIAPEKYRQQQHRPLQQLVDRWVADIRIKQGKSSLFRRYPLRLQVNIDEPPRVVDKDNPDGALMLDYRPLQRRLEVLLRQRQGDSGFLDLEGIGKVPADLIYQVDNTLHSLGSGPRNERQRSERDFEVVTGFLAISSLLKKELQLPYCELPPTAKETAKPNKSASIKKTIKALDGKKDVWDMAVFGEHLTLEAEAVTSVEDWREKNVEHEVTIYSADARNESDTGCCLSLPVVEGQGYKTGDLIALRGKGDPDWRLGALRWIQEGGTQNILVGVELLATSPLPVDVVTLGSDGPSKPFMCLLALSADHGPLLFAPYLPGFAQRRFAVNRVRHSYPIELGERKSFTPVFATYEFRGMSAVQRTDHVADILALLRTAYPEAVNDLALDTGAWSNI